MTTQIIKTEGRSPVAAASAWQSTAQPAALPKDDASADLGGVFRLLFRRRRWIYGSIVFFLALAGAVCLIMTPRYKATAQLEMLKQEQGALDVTAQDGQAQSGAADAEDALNFSLSLQTAVSVLKSDRLAFRVINELHLEDTDEFAYKPLILTDKAKKIMAEPIEQSPIKRAALLKKWSKRLKVQSVAGTRMIEVSFSHPDPDMAARIVNQLVSDYVDYRYEVRYAAAERTTEWLNTKLAAVKAQAQEAADRLTRASQAVGVYGSSSTDHNILAERMEQLDTTAQQAQANRAAKEAIYRMAQSGDPELVTGLMSGTQGAQGGSGGSTGGAALLIDLRQQEAELNTQYAEAAAKYGPDNPKLIQLRTKLQAAQDEIKAETNRIAGRARNEYLAAVAGEADANRALGEQKRVATDLQQKIANYDIAKNEADSAQALYQKLLESSKTMPILAGVHTTDLNVVNPAVPPGKPDTPIIPLYLAAGLFLGTLFGVAGAVIRDSVDTGLRNPDEIELITHLPVLGMVPRAQLDKAGKKKLPRNATSRARGYGIVPSDAGQQTSLPSLCDSHSRVMESFRSIRSSILLSRQDNPRRIFLITSAQPGEGKSFSALHLAAALAQNGATVLLVDADFRRGSLSRDLKMSFRSGLSTLIAGSNDGAIYHDVVSVPGLSFLPAGATPSNPAELIGSRKMDQLILEWRERYDFVVIDSPPVLPVTDAVVLSQMVDGVIVVARFAVSKQQAIIRTIRTLLSARAECFGVMVNDMDTLSDEYGNYDSYFVDKTDDEIIEGEPEEMAASGREK